MPIITVSMIEGRTKDQKAQLTKEITDAFVHIAGAKPENVRIIFSDYSKDNLAQNGKLLSDLPE